MKCWKTPSAGRPARPTGGYATRIPRASANCVGAVSCVSSVIGPASPLGRRCGIGRLTALCGQATPRRGGRSLRAEVQSERGYPATGIGPHSRSVEVACRHAERNQALLIIGVAAIGFNLRGPITSLPPVYPELQSRLGLSTATVSLLAATPVICFGVVSAFAAWLSRRVGEERVLLAAAAVLTCGLLLRGLWPGAMLFPGTVLASSAIAVMNVLLSSLSKRRWPDRAGLLIGIYLTALSLGGVTGSLLSVPLSQASGGPGRLVLGGIALPAALATLLWLPQARHTIHAVLPARARSAAVYRS